MLTKFINPYNFVSSSDSDVRTLFRPHTAVAGADKKPLLSGSIECALTNRTPMLVGGKHTPHEQIAGHKNVDFFRLDETANAPMIPAATIKGVIRSAYEAITNSCFVFRNPNDFEGIRTTQSKHEDIDGNVIFDLVKTGIVDYPPQEGHPGQIVMADKYLMLPEVLKESGIDPEKHKFMSVPVWCEPFTVHGTEDNAVPIRRIKRISLIQEGTCQVQGYLHVTDKAQVNDLDLNDDALNDIEEHNFPEDDRVAYRCLVDGGKFVVKSVSPANDESPFCGVLKRDKHGHLVIHRGKKLVVAIPREGETITFSKNEYDRYLNVQRHGLRNKKEDKQERGMKRHLKREKENHLEPNHLELKRGDVVFFRKDKAGEGAVGLTRASLGREAFDRSISDLMTPAQQPCWYVNREEKDNEKWRVCPACQMFGLLEDRRQTGHGRHAFAAAGRVRFTHAKPETQPGEDPANWIPEIFIPLKIMSSPKPGCTPFYLRGRMDKDGAAALFTKRAKDAVETVANAPFHYEEGAALRGRKFYVNQPDVSVESCKSDQGPSKDNFSARLLDAGKTFTFQVQFEGLTKTELGGLIYALALEGALHGVGAGKPLGMGACDVETRKLRLKTENYYRSLDPATRWKDGGVEPYVAAFKQLRAAQEGKDSFDRIPAIRELVQIRGKNQHPLPVFYPTKYHEYNDHGTRVRKPVGFKWFMDHASLNLALKRRRPQFLPLPTDIEAKPLLTALDQDDPALNATLDLQWQAQLPASRGRQAGPARQPQYPNQYARPQTQRTGNATGPRPRGAQDRTPRPILPANRNGTTVECEVLPEPTKKGKTRFGIVGGAPTDNGVISPNNKNPIPEPLTTGTKLTLRVKVDSPNNMQFEVP